MHLQCDGAFTSTGLANLNGGAYCAGDLTVTVSLTVAGLTVRPYISLKATTYGGTPSSIVNSAVSLGTPGTVTMTQMCLNTSPVCTRGIPGKSNYLLYTFTWTGAHPLGANFVAHATFQTGGTPSSPPNTPLIITNVTSTSIAVWIRGALTSGGTVYTTV